MTVSTTATIDSTKLTVTSADDLTGKWLITRLHGELHTAEVIKAVEVANDGAAYVDTSDDAPTRLDVTLRFGEKHELAAYITVDLGTEVRLATPEQVTEQLRRHVQAREVEAKKLFDENHVWFSAIIGMVAGALIAIPAWYAAAAVFPGTMFANLTAGGAMIFGAVFCAGMGATLVIAAGVAGITRTRRTTATHLQEAQEQLTDWTTAHNG